MRFPTWARKDSIARHKYLCLVMAAYASSDGSMYKLAHLAKVKYPTALKAMNAGRMTPKLAAQITAVVDGCGVRPSWLVAPELIQLNDDGEVVE